MLYLIQSFKDAGTEDVFNGKHSKETQKQLPASLWKITTRKLDWLVSAIAMQDLRIPSGNKLETLTRYRAGQHSIRINDQYRICFK